MRRRLAVSGIVIVLMTIGGLRAGASQVSEGEFDMQFYGPFLSPGLGDKPAVDGDEAQTGPIEWDTPTHGRIQISMWAEKGEAEFDSSADRKEITSLKVNIGQNLPAGQDDLAVWRHRHAYIKTSDGYVWNSLDDVRPPMDESIGRAYDQFLSDLWILWARRKIAALLGGAAASPEPASDAAADTLHKKMTMRYDSSGLVGTADGDFYIRAWGVPVHVQFEIMPHQPTQFDTWIIQLARPIKIDYSDKEWRRRHGYSFGLPKMKFLDYFRAPWPLRQVFSLDDDFPEPKPDPATLGPELDNLMKTCLEFWADVAVSLVMDGLDAQLKAKINYHATLPPKPALRSLELLQTKGAWPS